MTIPSNIAAKHSLLNPIYDGDKYKELLQVADHNLSKINKHTPGDRYKFSDEIGNIERYQPYFFSDPGPQAIVATLTFIKGIQNKEDKDYIAPNLAVALKKVESLMQEYILLSRPMRFFAGSSIAKLVEARKLFDEPIIPNPPPLKPKKVKRLNLDMAIKPPKEPPAPPPSPVNKRKPELKRTKSFNPKELKNLKEELLSEVCASNLFKQRSQAVQEEEKANPVKKFKKSELSLVRSASSYDLKKSNTSQYNTMLEELKAALQIREKLQK